MPMKMPFGPKGFQNIEWPIPNILANNIPGYETMATAFMKKTFAKKGVASIEDLREMCVDMGVRLIGCQMTMDVFGFGEDQFIDGVELGGAATFLEFAADSDISLFI
jgi:peroxiredoxin family protein